MTIVKDELKKNILDAFKQNKSLNKVSKQYKINKTTAFYWYKKLGKVKIIKVKINKKDEQLIGEFVGIFAGDGNYHRDNSYNHNITIHITGNDQKYINHVILVMTKLFSKKPHVYRTKSNMVLVRITSKDVYLFLKTFLEWRGKKSHSVYLKNNIEDYSQEFLKSFLRGLFDTDGLIRRSIPRFVFGTVSRKLSNNVEKILATLNIRYTKNIIIDKRGGRKPLVLIEIFRRDANSFLENIQPIH